MARQGVVGASEIRFARISAAAGTLTEVVAAVTGKKIRVIAYAVTVGAAAGELQFQDDATTPKELAHFFLAVNGGVSYAGSQAAPAFETGVGQALDIVPVATQTAEGHLAYVLV